MDRTYDTKLWNAMCLFVRKNISMIQDMKDEDDGLNDLPLFSGNENDFWEFRNKIDNIIELMYKHELRSHVEMPTQVLSFISKDDLKGFLADWEEELEYYAAQIPDDFINNENIDCVIDNVTYSTKNSLLNIEGNLKYKMIFLFVYRTGIRMRDLILLSNSNFVELVRLKKSIRLHDLFFPLYTPELTKLIFSMAKLKCNHLKLYNYKQIRRFFETGPVALFSWFTYLLFIRGYLLPTSLGLHTLRYMFIEENKIDPYSSSNLEYSDRNDNLILDIESEISKVVSSVEI